MIDLNDPRNEHILAHPHFLSGIEHERERILNAIEENIHLFAWVETDALREIIGGQSK